MERLPRLILSASLLFCLMSCSPPIWNKLQKRAAKAQGIAAKPEAAFPMTGGFEDWQQYWIEEAELPVRYAFLPKERCLDIVAPKGLTLWYKIPFKGNISIRYEIRAVVDGADSLDRCSDLNCFWMASDPMHPDSIFARKAFRRGVFSNYYSLRLYYVGYGGNGNTTTRFRKYDGDYDSFLKSTQKPSILKEYTDSAHLIKANHWYSVAISVKDGRVCYSMDGELISDYQDPEPLTSGWFGLRTTQNHLQVRDFTADIP